MNPTHLYSPQNEVLNWLSTRQFVKPHETLSNVLSQLGEIEPMARQTLERVEVELSTEIGRLSRVQLESIAISLMIRSRH